MEGSRSGEGDAAGESEPEEGRKGPFPLYRAVFQAAPDGIFIVDEEGVVRDVNQAAVELLGFTREELLGEVVEKVVPSGSRADHRRHRSGYMRHKASRPMGVGLSLQALRKDGRLVPVEVSLSPCRTEEGTYIIAAMRDVSERKRLRQLGVGTLRATEEERQRIARELHDDTAQVLAALLLRLRVLKRTTEGEDARGEQQRLMEEMHDELERAVEGVRRISRGLRPPALSDVGVATAIRGHLRSMLELSSLEAELKVEAVDEALDAEEQLVLYRVVQEALNNVLRHAGAESVRVEVQEEGEEVVAVVWDNGRGFDAPAELLSGEGLGLVGMQERARLVGGSLQIESSPGEGTRVELRLPKREAQRG